jgi:hypothetical protein
MSRNKNSEVRPHLQEREWLRSLGGGDIVEGAQNLIKQLLQKDDEEYYYPTKNWGGLFRRRRRDG